MRIADERYFTREHIESRVFGTSAALAEQAVHCLELVACLSRTGLDFQFKGGNALLLILDSPRRFSIDVDIATDEPPTRIEECIDMIVQRPGAFAHWTHRRHKTKPWIPISSYHLFYDSHFVGPEDAFVMLDAQLTRSPYTTEMKRVACGDTYACDAEAEVPLPESIIGDKLLTLGPYSLGIPVGKGKEAQRLKHVYDVSTLLERRRALDDVRASFRACMEHENNLQGKEIGEVEVMDDTLALCKTVLRDEAAPPASPDMTPVLGENIAGLPAFADHLFAGSYSWSQLQRDMARLAVCITAVCVERVTSDEMNAALRVAATRTHVDPSPCPGLACGDEARYLCNTVAGWLGRNPF
jgi:hypothetical protein